MALLTSVLSFRFGVVTASMSVGMIATLYRFETIDGTELPTDGTGATD